MNTHRCYTIRGSFIADHLSTRDFPRRVKKYRRAAVTVSRFQRAFFSYLNPRIPYRSILTNIYDDISYELLQPRHSAPRTLILLLGDGESLGLQRLLSLFKMKTKIKTKLIGSI